MKISESQPEPLTTGQIAEYCHVSVRAVLKWVEEGKLKAYRTPGKHSRIRVEDFIEFLNEYKMPVPSDLQRSSGRLRILIVDDDREMVNSIRRTLALDGRFELAEAYDGFSAGQKFGEFDPQLVILDIKMPGLDGVQVCQYIRNTLKNNDVKILVVSGVAGFDADGRISSMGADAAMAKPFDNQALKQEIYKLLKIKGDGPEDETAQTEDFRSK